MMKTESESERQHTAISENGERVLECEHPLEGGKDKRTGLPLELPEGMQTFQHLL